MKERKFSWYVETDPATNESLAAFLASEGLAMESESQQMYNGKRVHVWCVQHRVITKLEAAWASQSGGFEFKFRVFVQEGGGALRLWKFGRRNRKGTDPKVRQAIRQVQKIAAGQ